MAETCEVVIFTDVGEGLLPPAKEWKWKITEEGVLVLENGSSHYVYAPGVWRHFFVRPTDA